MSFVFPRDLLQEYPSGEPGMFVDTKGVIKRRQSKNDRQYNSQMKDKMTNNDLQNTKTPQRTTRTPGD